MAKEKESKEIAEVKPAGLPTEIFSGMEADATNASGFEGMSADDCAVPFLMLLQATSKKINGPAPLVGAKAGDLFNTVSNEIFQPPFRVIPCAFKKSWVEWRPRELGGGFVKEHATDELLAQCKKGQKGEDVLANGNNLVATAYHFVLVLKEDGKYERAVLSFTSTQLKKSKKWNTQMRSQQLRLANGKIIVPPMYALSYLLEVVQESNDKGSWKGLLVGKPERIASAEIYTAAKLFHQEATSGLVKVSQIVDEDAETIAEGPVMPEVM